MLSEIFIKPMRCEKKSAWIFSAFELLYFAHVFTQEHILQHFCPIKIAFSLFPPALGIVVVVAPFPFYQVALLISACYFGVEKMIIISKNYFLIKYHTSNKGKISVDE